VFYFILTKRYLNRALDVMIWRSLPIWWYTSQHSPQFHVSVWEGYGLVRVIISQAPINYSLLDQHLLLSCRCYRAKRDEVRTTVRKDHEIDLMANRV